MLYLYIVETDVILKVQAKIQAKIPPETVGTFLITQAVMLLLFSSQANDGFSAYVSISSGSSSESSTVEGVLPSTDSTKE